MSFVQRVLDVQFNLGVNLSTGVQNTFTEGGTQVYLKGLRASATIVKAGGLSMGNASLSIYGMTLSLMNQLSTLGINPLVIGPNFLTVLAGDSNGTSVVFQGSITNAWMDGNSMPNVPFRVEAHAGLFQAIAPCPPRSYPGAVDAAVVMAGLAAQMGLAFENSGVSVMLPPGTYFWGSARQQAGSCVKAAKINWIIDNGKLAIWPLGTARGTNVPLVSPDTGLKGYPTYTSKGIEVETLFNPSIDFGSNIKVQSSLKPACGIWNVFSLEHVLESQTPSGSWFSVLRASPPGSSVSSPGVTAIPD